MKFRLALALAFAASCATAALGDSIDFRGSDVIWAHSRNFNGVTAYAFGGSGLLYGKDDLGSEHGVGISGQSDNEITDSTFVQLDLSSISGMYSLWIGSTQNTEGFTVCFGNSLGSLGGSCQDFMDPGSDPYHTPNFTKSAQYVSIQADQGVNVLLDELDYTKSPVPEPSSLFLFGSGILGAAGIIRRKLAV